MSQDDNAVNDQATADVAPTESAPVTNNQSDAENDDLMNSSLDELEQEVNKETEGGQEAPADNPDGAKNTDETPRNGQDDQTQNGEKPLAPKSENRFQKLANENRELREQLSRVQTQDSQVATEQELLQQINPQTGDYFTPAEAERLARMQVNEQRQDELAQERLNLEVRQNQYTLSNESQQALREFSVFDETSKDYNPAVAASYDQMLGDSLIYQLPDGRQFSANALRASGVDLNTQATLVGSNISPYQLAKTIASSIGIGATQGQIKAQAATQQMLANADVSPSASQKQPKQDPMLAAFDEEAGL